MCCLILSAIPPISKLRDSLPKKVETIYVKSKFRESRDEKGNLSYISGKERIKNIEHMPVYDIEKERLVKIRDLNLE